MPFRFPLAAVLLVRENAELREERALQKIQQEMALVSRQIEELDAEIAAGRWEGQIPGLRQRATGSAGSA